MFCILFLQNTIKVSLPFDFWRIFNFSSRTAIFLSCCMKKKDQCRNLLRFKIYSCPCSLACWMWDILQKQMHVEGFIKAVTVFSSATLQFVYAWCTACMNEHACVLLGHPCRHGPSQESWAGAIQSCNKHNTFCLMSWAWVTALCSSWVSFCIMVDISSKSLGEEPGDVTVRLPLEIHFKSITAVHNAMSVELKLLNNALTLGAAFMECGLWPGSGRAIRSHSRRCGQPWT